MNDSQFASQDPAQTTSEAASTHQTAKRQTIKLHFAHANGFPAGSYRALFSSLPDNFKVFALDKFGHDPGFPVDRNWSVQADELLAYIQQNADGKVYAVGHSFGAVISYIAVCKRPDLFRGLIMLDPPLVTGVTRLVASVVKHTPLFDRFTPAQQAETRNRHWPTDHDLVDYFKRKTLFKDMHIQCVKDYVRSATVQTEEGQTLTFDPQVEADIFRTVPLDIHRYYGQLKVPALLLTGENTKVCLPQRIRPFVRNNPIDHQIVERGGHMFPLEQPKQVAALISQQILRWSND